MAERKELEDQEIAKRAKKVMKKASPIKKKKKAKSDEPCYSVYSGTRKQIIRS